MSEADSGSLILLNPNTGMLDIEASAGLSRGALSKKLRAGEGITGWVAESGQPYRSGDVVRDKRYVPIDPRVRSEMAVPLLLRKRGETPNQVIGVINIDSRKANAFSARHQRALTDFARAAT
jgi:putative methionine-R-sulfoxide reductase with GAF domain